MRGSSGPGHPGQPEGESEMKRHVISLFVAPFALLAILGVL